MLPDPILYHHENACKADRHLPPGMATGCTCSDVTKLLFIQSQDNPGTIAVSKPVTPAKSGNGCLVAFLVTAAMTICCCGTSFVFFTFILPVLAAVADSM